MIRGEKLSEETTLVLNHLHSVRNNIELNVTNTQQISSNKINVRINLDGSNVGNSKVYFIGLGVDSFRNISKQLGLCVKDIKSLARLFSNIYPSEIIVDTFYNQNVTRDKLLAIKHLLLKTSVNDIVILAYAGHGIIDSNSKYYLCTYDTKFESPNENAISYEDFENLLDGITARKKLALIDACHSGEFDSDDIQELLKDNSVTSISNNVTNELLYKISNSALSFNRYDLMKELFNDFSNYTGSTIISAASAVNFAIEDPDLKNGYFTSSILKIKEDYSHMTVNKLKSLLEKYVFTISHGLQRPTSRHELTSYDWQIW